MRTLANILWYFPFLGFLNALAFFVFGSILTITVVAAPIGLGLIQYSKFLLSPFKFEMISKEETNLDDDNKYWKLYGNILKIVYIVLIGVPSVIIACIQIVALAFSVVGIPCAIVLAKSLGTIFQPVGKICVPREVANVIQQQNAQEQAKKYMN